MLLPIAEVGMQKMCKKLMIRLVVGNGIGTLSTIFSTTDSNLDVGTKAVRMEGGG